MIKNLFLPTTSNNYTPYLLKKGTITIYTLILLVFNIISSNIPALQASAAVDSRSLVALHNQEREKEGLKPLSLNSKLVESAQTKAKAMLASDCWDHYCPNGKSPWDFFDDAGYDYIYAGENLAEGFSDNQKVFNAWMNSKTHKENILRPEFTEIGISIAYGKFQGIENNAVIVVHFGTTKEIGQLPTTNNNAGETKSSTFIITSPLENEILNTNTPKITGQSNDGKVQLTDNNKKLGESIAQDGIFTYRVANEQALVEGQHTLKAENLKTKQKDTVNFEVDTLAPELSNITFDSVISNNNEIVSIRINASKDTISIESEDIEYRFVKIDDTLWQLQIPLKTLNKFDETTLVAYDKASNKTETVFSLKNIKGQAASNAENEKLTATGYSLFERIGIRRIINTIFITLLIILIVIDYYALMHTDLPIGIVKTKTHYHLSIFIILLAISIAGGTAGELLEGQKL